METTPLNKSADELLLEASAKDDAAAFAEIVEQHQAMVYRTCLRVLRNDADAQDAAQATFILFHKKCRDLKRGIVLGGWLYRTAELVCREYLRSSGRRKRREEETMIMKSTDENTDEETWNTLQPQLDLALAALPQKYRDVVVLRYLEGKTTQEAAATMAISASVVTTRLARAVDQLRGWFQRRGIALTAGALSILLVQNASAAAVPATLGPSILAAVGTGVTVGAATSANTSLMVKGGLVKLGAVSSMLLNWSAHLYFLCGDILSIHRWAKSGFKFPRWVHVFAACMACAGVAVTVALGVMGLLTYKLAAACIFVPPAAAYIGWLWVWGPLLGSGDKNERH